MVADFHKKSNRDFFNKQLLYKTAGIAFILLFVVLVVSDIKIYQKKRILTAQISNYQRQINEIKRSSQNLKNEIANADNKDYLEKLAYEQLGQQRPGEKEIIFINSKTKVKEVQKTQSSWEKFLSWIKSKF